jgi:O-antigen/teichoic acid export membrane protein
VDKLRGACEPARLMQSTDTSVTKTDGRLVARNALYLTAGQALTVPLSVLINAVTARYLGSTEFGYIYLATTMCGFGLLAVEWGQQGALPALIARDRTIAAKLLGTSVTWRLGVAVIVWAVLTVAAMVLGYTKDFYWALGLSLGMLTLNSVAAGYKDTIRGFERTDIPAIMHVVQQLMAVALVIPVLVLGGRMRGVLGAQMVVSAITILLLWRALRTLGVQKLSFTKTMLSPLLRAGTPFVFVDLVMLLQPNIDAIFLSKLAPPEVMGWFGVSRRLVGLLLFPASALIGALYPTLCRLYATDHAGYARVARGALYGVSILAVPVALSCGLYPDVGVAFFSKASFAPSANNLRILSLFLFLVYFTMPLGTAILAAGKQRAWSIVQSLCVVVSLVLDPLLIPVFQRRFGNGGMGPSLVAVIGEVIVVGCGVALAPRSLFDRGLLRSFGLAFAAGVIMTVVALLLRGWNPFLAAPLALLAYAVTLWGIGGLRKDYLELLPGYSRFMRTRRSS